MQALGLTPQEPSEGRIKSLFWPKIVNVADVDNLTNQGFWLCFIIAAITMLISIVGGIYFMILDAVFYYLGGNGVRQRSKAAAIFVFGTYAAETLLHWKVSYAGGGTGEIARIFFSALLLSNVRAIWMASNWRKNGGDDEAAFVLNETFADKLSGVWARAVWGRLRIVFFILAAVEIIGVVVLARS